MPDHRIHEHPILPAADPPTVTFSLAGPAARWRGQGETIASALFANGVRTFGHHPKDGAPQGIFCANGQCAQCTVVADGLPVKSCMVPVRPGMNVQPLDGLPALPDVSGQPPMPPDRDGRRRVPDHRRRPGRPHGGDRARQGRRPRAASSTTSTASAASSSSRRTSSSARSRPATPARAASTSRRSSSSEVRQFENVRVWLNSTVALGLLRPHGRRAARRPRTSSSGPTSCSSPPARARSRSSSRATRCPASTAPAPSRRSSTATSSGRPSGSSSSAAATSA